MILKRIAKFLYLKIKLYKKCRFYFSTDISLRSTFEGMNSIDRNSLFNGNLGLGSYIGKRCIIHGYIGKFCSIADNVSVVIGIHPYTYPFTTTSPYFFSNGKQNGHSLCSESLFEEYKYSDTEKKYPVTIGHDCWIGYDAKIISGIHIGNGAVILAGAVVTKDVPAYAIVGGIPAKIIKYRYDINTINMLEKFKWWDKSIEWLQCHKDLLINIELLKQYQHEK